MEAAQKFPSKSTDTAGWSSGQDAALSRRKQGFDSPTGYLKNLGYDPGFFCFQKSGSCPEKEQDFHGTYVYDTGSFCFEPCGVPPACAGPRREREVSRFPVSSRKAGSPLFPCDLAKAGRFLFWQKHFLCRPFFCPYGHTLTFSIEYQRNRRRCADRKGPDIPVRPFNVHEAISIKKQPARMAGCQKT